MSAVGNNSLAPSSAPPAFCVLLKGVQSKSVLLPTAILKEVTANKYAPESALNGSKISSSARSSNERITPRKACENPTLENTVLTDDTKAYTLTSAKQESA